MRLVFGVNIVFVYCEDLTMNPFILLVLAIFSLVPERAAGDIIRRATIPAFLFGTWAENSEQCISKDKSNVVIESLRYGDGSGSCAVRWVVETPSSHGAKLCRPRIMYERSRSGEDSNRKYYHSATRQ
jgi:hypothetical protein